VEAAAQGKQFSSSLFLMNKDGGNKQPANQLGVGLAKVMLAKCMARERKGSRAKKMRAGIFSTLFPLYLWIYWVF
jgi:hypothetical protein